MALRSVLLLTGLYFLAAVVVAYLTRATSRRSAGAVAGGAVVGLAALGAIAVGEGLGWWQVPLTHSRDLLLAAYVGLAVSMTPVYLITWRIARRFGWRGLLVCAAASAIIGPLRDYAYAAKFPEWMVFAPGIAPLLADGVTYAMMIIVGHTVMRIVAGPAGKDSLARCN